MVANYVRIVRRSAAVAAIAAAVMMALAAGLAGSKGLAGAAIGVGIVAAFFAISVIVVGRAARVSPQAMMVAALTTYLVKIVILLILVGQFQNSAAFNPRMFGMTAIVCVLVYSAAQVVWSMRLKTLYVDPPASASPSTGER
jgi:ATP synthase protein I